MRDRHIIIGPFHLISLLECTIHKKANEHFSATVVGYISEEQADETVMRCAANTHFYIQVESENREVEQVFSGLIEDVSIESESGLKKLTVHALSYTRDLDRKERVRTFQNERQTYQSVIKFISEQNSGSVFIYTSGRSEQTNGMVVQYQETDWSFMKRMASRLNTVVIPDCKNSNVCLCFGIPKKSSVISVQPIEYHISKRIDEYAIKKGKGVSSFTEQDSMEYVVKSRDSFDLCQPMDFFGRRLLVYEIYTELVGNELIHTYYLRSENGFRTAMYSNEKIIGTSIMGKIIDVKHDIVKVKIYSDNDRPDGIAKWFDYATVYSSPGGSGWYCMPEEGDKIRVYFPDAEENHAYVISAMHLGVMDDMREQPNEKSIRTIFDKEIRFTPSKILITNHKGLSITLDDEFGIRVKSNKKIDIDAADMIQIASGDTVIIQAAEGIVIQQQNNAIAIKNGIRTYGLAIRHDY